MMQDGQQGVHGGMRHGMMGTQSGAAGQPTMPGQEAFGTIQEVVQILEADPTTDWSKVNIAALREHLIDMNEVTLRAVATEQALEQRRRDRGDWRGPYASGDQDAWFPAHVRRARRDRLECEDGRLAEWSQAQRYDQRPQAGKQAQGARLHGNHGAGWAPSAPPSDDGEGRLPYALRGPEAKAGAAPERGVVIVPPVGGRTGASQRSLRAHRTKSFDVEYPSYFQFCVGKLFVQAGLLRDQRLAERNGFGLHGGE